MVLGLLIVEDPRSHSDTPPSVETSGRVFGLAKISTWQHTQHSQQTPMHTGRFEPEIPAASRWPQTCAFDRADTRKGFVEVSSLSNANSCPRIRNSSHVSVCVCVCVCVCVRVRESARIKWSRASVAYGQKYLRQNFGVAMVKIVQVLSNAAVRGLLEKYPTVFFYANTWWIII